MARAEDGSPQENRLIRAQLESLAADLAASKVNDDDLENLGVLLENLDSCPPENPAWSTLDRRFHFAIYECARSPVLLSLLNVLWRSLQGPTSPATPDMESDRAAPRVVGSAQKT